MELHTTHEVCFLNSKYDHFNDHVLGQSLREPELQLVAHLLVLASKLPTSDTTCYDQPVSSFIFPRYQNDNTWKSRAWCLAWTFQTTAMAPALNAPLMDSSRPILSSAEIAAALATKHLWPDARDTFLLFACLKLPADPMTIAICSHFLPHVPTKSGEKQVRCYQETNNLSCNSLEWLVILWGQLIPRIAILFPNTFQVLCFRKKGPFQVERASIKELVGKLHFVLHFWKFFGHFLLL